MATHAEIAELKEQINHQAGIICVLEEKLEHTRKEIWVRITPEFTTIPLILH